jgi:hypothetical protein
MRLRPHHLLDIITQYGAGLPFQPHAYGHAVHTVAEAVLADPNVTIESVVGADDICAPCKHLIAGRCDDVLRELDPPLSKQDYNDDLDRRVLAHLGIVEGAQLTCREFLAVVRDHLPGLAEACTHPGEDRGERLARLTRGLARTRTPG